MYNTHKRCVRKDSVQVDGDSDNDKSKRGYKNCKDDQLQTFTSTPLTRNVADMSTKTASNETTMRGKNVKFNPTSIAVGMAAARLPHRKLSERQRQRLRSCI